MRGEFDFIETLRRRTERQAKAGNVSLGIGDDAAVVNSKNTSLVITADLLVEEIDFRLDWTTPQFLGHKALAVSLSDIAAMGARPASRFSRSAFRKKYGEQSLLTNSTKASFD